MLLYVNDLRDLPNFGCRTTGMALEQLIQSKHEIERFDAMESVNAGGWDAYARGPIKNGGVIPHAIYKWAWKKRRMLPHFFWSLQFFDRLCGGSHDYISQNPNKSVIQYRKFLRRNPRLSALEERIREADGVIINGEGTLIIGRPTYRDALYILFVLALAKDLGKPVYLLNAMIAPCPYNGEDKQVLEFALPLLSYCKVIALRELSSYNYLSDKIGNSNLEVIPDALFTWGERIRRTTQFVREEPRIGETFPANADFSCYSFDKPYICISGSSSAWRHEPVIYEQFAKLIYSLMGLGFPVYCVETCDGDTFLRTVARRCGANFIAKSTPVLTAAGIIAGSLVYVTGRYHPAIMASASGTPCVFLSSNSHKTLSLQELLGYEQRIEYPICPNDAQIEDILGRVRYILENRDGLSRNILDSFENQRDRAMRYAAIIPDKEESQCHL